MSTLDSGDQGGRQDQYGQSDPSDQHDHDEAADRGDEAGRGDDDRLDRILQQSRGDRADRGPRWNRGSGPYVDTQLFSELDTGVYEAVATLEYLGSAVTVDQIREATGLDAPAVGEILDALTEQGVLTRRRTRAGDAFELARRDWSATPETRSH
jgi:DNA-binding transcriptional ArsR family regulator